MKRIYEQGKYSSRIRGQGHFQASKIEMLTLRFEPRASKIITNLLTKHLLIFLVKIIIITFSAALTCS